MKIKVNRIFAMILTAATAMLFALISNVFLVPTYAAPIAISNDSLSVVIGDLGQIETLNIVSNPVNNQGNEINFVLPNNSTNQNGVQHQWMGELIFSYRTNDTGVFPDDREGFVEVDTNKTLAAGGSTTYSNATANLETNPYIRKTQVNDSSVKIEFIGHDEDSNIDRAMKGFDVTSVFDMDTEDGSMLWEITLENKGTKYIEIGDLGLPMPWNNKYTSLSSTYNERVTAHTFAGADSGYAYAIRPSGEGNYVLFTPVVESGARIEYVDNWVHNNNGVSGERSGSLFQYWTGDSGGWQPGLSVYYVHSKDIYKTGRSYYEDNTSLVLAPGESKTYQFKFSAIRAGDNSPQEDSSSANNASDSVEEREANLRSILYQSGMIDAVAVPSFQTAINMPAKLDLHYDDSLISDVTVKIQSVEENDPYDINHIPNQVANLVNNARTGRGLSAGNLEYNESCTYVETKTVDGEQHHIYDLTFGCIGNNSVRVEYKLKVGDEYVDKFTQFEFNVLAEIDEAVDAHASFMVENQQDTDPESETYGIYKDWYFTSGVDTNTTSHWGDDWSHDNINFIAMKNYLNPDAEQVQSIELYLIDFMWESYMKNTQSSLIVSNYLSASGIYSETTTPYSRTFSEMMVVTGYFNMYRIQRAYPDLIEYRKSPIYYLEKAYDIYVNRVGTGATGFYGEQQIPDMIEALRAEGMNDEADNLQDRFANLKGSNMANTTYPYGSEFSYDNTGEEGIYASSKALLTYYPNSSSASNALAQMQQTEAATRAKRGIQPTWYYYADPAFVGGESWWNFQYTASLAGSITNDWLLYQDNNWDVDSRAWAQRVNYGAKISNFNAINMGQIDDSYIGNVSWRYTAYKGGHGAMNVNDGGTRVMNNGWNDFSGEADEGLYGSLLSISSDVVTDPVFGLFGYGCEVEKSDGVYKVVPLDGVGKRLNLLDEKMYLTLETDQIIDASIAADSSYFSFSLKNLTSTAHVSKIDLSGDGLEDGYYSIKLGEEVVGQCYVSENQGTAYVQLTEDENANVTIEKMESGQNQEPTAFIETPSQELQAMVSFTLTGSAIDDGAPDGTLTYSWEVLQTPEGGELTLTNPDRAITEARGTKGGNYVLELTVSDGQLSGTSEVTITLDDAPERQAPTITSATATQDAVNQSVITLTGEATADPLYNGELTYEWSLIDKPEGADVIFADKDQLIAKMKVTEAGTYTLRFTATDSDKSSYEEIIIEVTGDVDGIDRAVSVITQVGVAPVLPDTVEVIKPDGTIATVNVAWDAVDSSKYEAAGWFKVEGTVKDSDLKVAVTVYVVDKEAENYAEAATPSAIIDTPSDLGGVTKLNDGIDPGSSSDTSNGVWHNWNGDQGGSAWVKYEWDEAFLAASMDVYVFRDGGGNFRPTDMQVTLRDENGNWYTPRAVEGLGNELNQYNTTTFEPAYITGIRIDMKPVTLGCGIIEWKVYGYGFTINDKAWLRELITAAEGLGSSFIESGYDQISEKLTAAQEVNSKLDSTQEEIDAAAQALADAYSNLVPHNGNVAYLASITASYCSSWESVDSIKDGGIDNNKHFGTWGNTSIYETVTLSWPTGAKISKSDIYFWNDGGGILDPASYEYQYQNAEGEWISLGEIDGSEVVANDSNPTEFDEAIEMWALKVIVNKQSNNGEGIGILEWEAYGELLSWSKGSDVTDYKNIAPDATAYAEYTCNDGNDAVLAAINDGLLPNSSSDFVAGLVNGGTTGQNAWHNWGQESNETAYLQYTWDKPVVIDKTAAYYFQNGAGHFNPSAVEFQYLNDKGEWVEVQNPVGLGVELDKLNVTTFEKVNTTSFRMIMTKETLGLGVFEWEVYGYYASEGIETYELSFNTNGGKEVEPVKEEAGTVIDLSEYTTEKEGYTFEGWYSDEALENEVTSITLESDTVVYAKWTKIVSSYTVTFDSNEGTEVKTQTIAAGETAVEPKDPTKSGHVFIGWYIDEVTETPYDFNTAVTGDITLYARWVEETASTYTVTFNDGTAEKTQTVVAGETAVEPKDPTKAGHVFIGWYTDEALETAYDFNSTVTGDITLYARWAEETASTYTVTFNDGEVEKTQTVVAGETAVEPKDPTKAGHVFIGWYIDEVTETPYDFNAAVIGDITLYAKWAEETASTYTVTFKDGEAEKTQTVVAGETAVEPKDPTKEGFVFIGWYTDEATETPYDFNTSVTEDITLYVKWAEETASTYAVTFNDGTAEITQTVAAGETAVEPKNPTKEGYVFIGWYTDEALETAYDFNSSVTEDTTLYARWVEETASTYSVTFDSAEGTEVKVQTVVAGETAVEPKDPTKESYTFIGWYTDEALETSYDFNTAVTEDITLYAKWSANHMPYINGFENGTFLPDSSITRGQVAVMLYKLTEDTSDVKSYTNSFGDVESGSWYYDAIMYLAEKEVIEGYSDGTFAPEAPITRAELTALVVRYAGLTVTGTPSFSDVEDTHWAVSYIATAESNMLIEGYEDGIFAPENNMTRAETVTLLNRLFDRVPEDGMFAGYKMPFTDVKSLHWAWGNIIEASVEHPSSH